MNLKELKALLESKSGEELFGEKGSNHPDYRKYARMCHPDTNTDPMAKEVFQLLGAKAKEIFEPIVITTGKRKIELQRKKFAKGDISDLFLTADEKQVVKITRKEKHNDFLTNERVVLDAILKTVDGQPTLSAALPSLADSFTMRVKNRPRRRIHVFDYDPGFLTIEQILSAPSWKHGVEPETFAWIFKRLLLSLTVVHNAGYVHGAVTPDHFLCHKVNHAGRLIDFIHAVETGKTVDVIRKNKRFYPKEVLDKKPATFETDIYMAGKIGFYMLGGCPSSKSVPGTVPDKFAGFLRALTDERQSRRPDDAWQLHEDFSGMLERIFGPPRYHELTGV
jgi:serine/threonine protein kinase